VAGSQTPIPPLFPPLSSAPLLALSPCYRGPSITDAHDFFWPISAPERTALPYSFPLTIFPTPRPLFAEDVSLSLSLCFFSFLFSSFLDALPTRLVALSPLSFRCVVYYCGCGRASLPPPLRAVLFFLKVARDSVISGSAVLGLCGKFERGKIKTYGRMYTSVNLQRRSDSTPRSYKN
jgi:hypothetical protein